ncbi:hypothetical protein AB8A20_12050 [Tardiphaga sp. 604_B6_N1_1]|uniref:hypothetical protein n=1 Tax=unclassified Tardiphaga TaxID=2631404 RepID=UPI003F204BEB
MSSAIELVVTAYVQLGDQASLDAMLKHRRGLVVELSGKTGFDLSVPGNAIEAEMEVIEAGLAKLPRSTP